MTQVLVVTADVLRAQMAGPAMRAWHMSHHLARHGHNVRLVTTSPYCELAGSPASGSSGGSLSVSAVGPEGLTESERWADVMVLQGYITHHHPFLLQSKKVLVFDVYDPLHLETLALTKGHISQARDDHVRLSVRLLNEQLARADFLICASDRQRDLYIGQLCSLGRANALTYDSDPTLRSLIDIVPFGLPDEPPEHTKASLRGVVPGIEAGDDVLVWAGGVYDWFDPLTLVRAVASVARSRSSVRLFFMGMRHPNPDVPEMQVAKDTRALSAELGLTGVHVFFNDGWVDYADRQDYLLEADIGVSMHFASAETRFSFRTRQLDYLWAGLPMVASEGDTFAELIGSEGLGEVVPPGDPEALADALLRLLANPERARECRRHSAVVRERFRWSRVLSPLTDFCDQPHPAVDLPRTATWPPAAPEGAAVPEAAGRTGHKTALELARHHYREGGLSQVARQALDKAGRKARRAP